MNNSYNGMIACPQCQTIVEDDNLFCIACGTPISVEAQIGNPFAQAVVQPEPSPAEAIQSPVVPFPQNMPSVFSQEDGNTGVFADGSQGGKRIQNDPFAASSEGGKRVQETPFDIAFEGGKRAQENPFATASLGQETPFATAPQGQEAPFATAPQGQEAPFATAPQGQETPFATAPQGQETPFAVAPQGQETPFATAPQGQETPFAVAPQGQEAPFAAAPQGQEAPFAAAQPIQAVETGTIHEEETEGRPLFASGLADWDIVPPAVMVRRKRKS